MQGKTDMLTLKVGDRIHFDDDCKHNWRVNGRPITWKREPNRCEISVKYGLKTFGCLFEYDSFHLESECPHKKVSSPVTTNRSFYKPPTSIQPR